MAEISHQVQDRSKDVEEDMVLPEVESRGGKTQMAGEVHGAKRVMTEEKPTKAEVLVWYLYGLCSYFVHTVLIPIVFPLIISQTVAKPLAPGQGWYKSHHGLQCTPGVMQLYDGLVHGAVHVGSMKFSPLEWTSVSWMAGLILSAPILALVSVNLDHGPNQQLISAAATGIGALFCLPAGFFRKSWIFPPYIAAIVAASTIVGATHARHLGLMIRGFVGSTIKKHQFAYRTSFGSWLSLYSTAAGCLGAAIMSSFTYHMLNKSDHFTALWVVSIFSGLTWGIGMIHVFSCARDTESYTDPLSSPNPLKHLLSIFKFPHAAGSLAGVFLSSFTATCIFAGGLLYAIGELCMKAENVLYFWLAYFLCPLLSLPLAHPLQQAMRLDAEKMQLLGFVLAAFTSGFGFYYRSSIWSTATFLVFAAIQGTSTGLLHAFGRVLWLDCSPAGKEGAFSAWFSWARALGACSGFALATGVPGDIGTSFGVSFCAGVFGMLVLIFGNISSLRGAKAAGHVVRSEAGSPVREPEDNNDPLKELPASVEVPSERRIEV